MSKTKGKAWHGHGADDAQVSTFQEGQKKHFDFQPLAVRAKKGRRVAEANAGLKPMRFVSLHHHSTFSFLDGFQMPEAHVRRASELEMGALAMTEHGNIFSHVKLEKAAEEIGVKPLFGCEFYMGWTDEKRRAQKKNHLTVVAKNAEGYANLLHLVNLSWAAGFYYEPTVDWRWLVEFQKGLVVLSGCQGSALFTALVGGKHVAEDEASYQRGLKVARWMSDRLDDFYIEVQAFPELDKTRRANPMLADIAREIHRSLVATVDCHYTIPEESEIQQGLHAVRPGEKRSAEELARDWGYEAPLCHPLTDKELYRKLKNTGLTKEQAIEAIVSTEEIGQECSVTLPRLPQVQYPLPDGYDSARDLWRDWLRKGWDYRGCRDLPAKERRRYRDQLNKEMEVIEAKGYENLFLITSDIVRFAKRQQIPVGPARGSAAASLVCWLLRITEINPMDYEYLVFERFIDWSRADMPDIDLDFASYGRPIIRQYAVDKYGEDCVNNIGTFTYYKAKNSLDDTARVYRIPKAAAITVKGLLIERSSGDLRASATIEDTANQFEEAGDVFTKYPELQNAMDLEGNVKGFGVHAAGLVLSTQPIESVCATIKKEVPKGSGNWMTVLSMDKHDCVRQGLEKLDLLGLNTMDMIAEALHNLDMDLEELYNLPLDDPEVLQGFNENDTVGIFQFDGKITRTVTASVQPEHFAELALLIALARPGPLHGGGVSGYIEAKFGGKEPHMHPALASITKDTRGQIIFQEQIMKIVHEIGGFDWEGVGYIRKIISKKMGKQEFQKQWKRFRDGALELHKRDPDMPPMDEQEAQAMWNKCVTAGVYAFNAAHSFSYAMIAYWSMWLKRKHPTEFFAAAMMVTERSSSSDKGKQKVLNLRRDAIRGKGPRKPTEVLPPNLDSGVHWLPEREGVIRAGWEQIPKIGEKTAQKIVEFATDNGGLKSLPEIEKVHGIGEAAVTRIAEFINQEDPFDVYKLEETLEGVKDELEGMGLPKPTHNSEEVLDVPKGKVVWMGVGISRNLKNIFEAHLSKTGEELDPATVKRPDLFERVVMHARDADDSVVLTFNRFVYPKFKEAIWGIELGKDVLVCECKKNSFGDDERSSILEVKKMYVLQP
jgi:DNA polymerase-3 subunit alpha